MVGGKVLVYGSNGYTGSLVARVARERNVPLELVLAGRSAEKVEPLARELGYDARVFGLDVPSTIDACLEDADVVIHCAGPFSRTAAPMAEACLRTGTHYLDVTGELAVFEALAARDEEAKMAGVMLMPGVGFDVVPSDCLAVHVAHKVPGATTLRIGILSIGGSVSHGTATTMAENAHRGAVVRRNGKLVPIRAGSLRREIDFGRGPRPAMALPWGDLATAWRSTGIPNIETYFAARSGMIWGARALSFVPWLVKSKPVQTLVKRRIEARSAGPSDEERARAKSILWAEATGPSGARAAATLETPNGYTLTADAALAIAAKVVAGEWKAGYQTPAMVYGADFVLSLPGVTRRDS